MFSISLINIRINEYFINTYVTIPLFIKYRKVLRLYLILFYFNNYLDV